MPHRGTCRTTALQVDFGAKPPDAASGSENILFRLDLADKLDSLVKTRFEKVPAI